MIETYGGAFHWEQTEFMTRCEALKQNSIWVSWLETCWTSSWWQWHNLSYFYLIHSKYQHTDFMYEQALEGVELYGDLVSGNRLTGNLQEKKNRLNDFQWLFFCSCMWGVWGFKAINLQWQVHLDHCCIKSISLLHSLTCTYMLPHKRNIVLITATSSNLTLPDSLTFCFCRCS